MLLFHFQTEQNEKKTFLFIPIFCSFFEQIVIVFELYAYDYCYMFSSVEQKRDKVGDIDKRGYGCGLQCTTFSFSD